MNDCVLFVVENNSYKDFIAIVRDESIVGRCMHLASLCTLSVFKIRKRVNLLARQFGDGTKKEMENEEFFVAHAMQS